MNNTLTKADIVNAVHEKIERPRAEMQKIIESLLVIMKTAIVRDHALLISGFGKFDAYAKKARKGRNPQTSESIILEPRKVVVFRLLKTFRNELI